MSAENHRKLGFLCVYLFGLALITTGRDYSIDWIRTSGFSVCGWVAGWYFSRQYWLNVHMKEREATDVKS